MTARILVTGSRDWTDRDAIEQELIQAWDEVADGHPVTLVSGACPTGADRIAEDIWESWKLPIERHLADWKQHGKKAGFIRNFDMVQSGVDICVAFIRNSSRGAAMTASLAENAGIPTRRIEAA